MLSPHTTLNKIKQQMGDKPDLPLKFYVGNLAINPGYHVTEVKFASIKSLDCGRYSPVEQWNEITVQLLDGAQNSTQDYMTGSKFLAIVDKALATLDEQPVSALNVEYAPNNGPIRKLKVDSIVIDDKEISVTLANEYAVCKPLERVKAAMASTTKHQSTSTASDQSDCCTVTTAANSSACCG